MSLFAEYAAAGWMLCGIEPGSKGPKYPGWNEPDSLAQTTAAAEGLDGAGLAHAASGTAALDIDDMELARPWLAERGVDIDALIADPTSVQISSGRPNRTKLLYRMKRPMRTLKPTGSGVELRSATAAGKSVQDVLPPTIHPDTKKPYAWKYTEPMVGHWSALPPIPASLLALWRELLAEVPADHTTDAPKTDASIATVRKAIYQYIQSKRKDVSDYADWIDVGMRLHDQTGGAAEGLDIWEEWSATDKSKRATGGPRFEGRDNLELHWRSFNSGGKNAVGMAGALAQLPADADEFDIESEGESEEETTAQLLKKKAKETKAEAIATLEKRLVYVYTAEKYFDTQRRRVINTESALEHMFTPSMPRKRGGKKESPVQLLKESSTKRFVDKVGFHPGEGAIFKDREDYSYANTYDGSRLPVALEPTAEELAKVEWLFGRIDDPAYRKWLKEFYGFVVQRPGVKIKSAPLIWSETQGNGKTTLVRMIPSLLVGSQYSKEVTHTQLEDSFTGYLLDTWHVNLTEFRASNRNEREALSKKVEAWISEDAITIRPMHQVAYTMPNHFFVTGSSNFDDAAAISGQDRKWAIHEIKAAQFTEAEQEWIYTDFLLTPRAAGVLRHYFLHIDISDFSPSAKAIQTSARGEMVAASASSDTEAMTAAFDERTGPFAHDVVLITDITEWMRKQGGFKPSMHRIGRILAKTPFNGTRKRFRAGESLYNGVVIRNHATWVNATGKEVMEHIQGLTDELSTEFDDESVDLME